MLAILRKEISAFFTTAVGYLVIGLFLTILSLFLWVFEGPFNIPNSGYADLAPFFLLAPWLFCFVIPAVTMRSFSEEQKTGTLELLLTKPITLWQLVLGKYLGAFVLICIALVPTLTYVFVIYQLGNPVGNLDVGVTVGSFMGLLLLAACFVSIGVFTSTLSTNQIVSFVLAVFISFVLYFGFEGLGSLALLGSTSMVLKDLGMQAHYESISRGVIDTRDIVYFGSLIFFVLFITVQKLKRV